MERGLDTNVRKARRAIFKAVAELAYQLDGESAADDPAGFLSERIEALPYELCPVEDAQDWENIYRERAVAGERLRLALGMKLRPEDKPVHVSQGVELSNVAEKYYEPPLMQVIPSACNACPENVYVVSDQCMGCVAHPCMEVCPKGAISMKNGKSVIDS